mgnify:CR=1 FL=1|tara:strand:+ start:1078 stop:1464 length:387 start_codon:yes stop_codon:yes gene_type:complete
MGFFSGLFKEESNWNEKELMALFSLLKHMGYADGEFDKDELNVIQNFIINLPGSSVKNEQQFIALGNKSMKFEVESHFNVIKNMNKKKKDTVMQGLGAVAAADGKVDLDELQLMAQFNEILNTKNPEF